MELWELRGAVDNSAMLLLPETHSVLCSGPQTEYRLETRLDEGESASGPWWCFGFLFWWGSCLVLRLLVFLLPLIMLSFLPFNDDLGTPPTASALVKKKCLQEIDCAPKDLEVSPRVKSVAARLYSVWITWYLCVWPPIKSLGARLSSSPEQANHIKVLFALHHNHSFFHEYGRRVGMVPRSSLKEGKKNLMVEKRTRTTNTN